MRSVWLSIYARLLSAVHRFSTAARGQCSTARAFRPLPKYHVISWKLIIILIIKYASYFL